MHLEVLEEITVVRIVVEEEVQVLQGKLTLAVAVENKLVVEQVLLFFIIHQDHNKLAVELYQIQVVFITINSHQEVPSR